MVYAGFWRRFASLWIDVFVFLPVTALLVWASSLSRGVAIALLLPSAVLGWAYHIYFHARWGQTIGKMAMRIRVVSTDGSPIQLRQAVLRTSVDITLGLMYLAVTAWAIVQIPEPQYGALGWWARQMRLAELTSQWRWVSWLQTAWVWSEVVTMLFNERRRALHDYLAGTVVVQVLPAEARQNLKTFTEPGGSAHA